MAVPHQAQIRDQFFLNWVRAGLALKYTKEGIECFINDETKVFHSSLLSQFKQQPQSCGLCTLDILLPHQPTACPVGRTNCICSRGSKNQRRICPNNVCGTLFDAIVSKHRFQAPSWKNSHISKWVSDQWEVAKNFLPNTGGYCNILSARDTDLSGLVNIAINLLNITVHNKLTVSSYSGPDDFCKCRGARNDILHCASQALSDSQLTDYISVMKATLQCTGALKNNTAAQQAVTKLSLLETSAFEITDDKIKEVREMALLAIQNEGSKQVEAVKNEGEKQIENLQQVATTIADARDQEELHNLKSHLIETYLAQLQPDRLPEVERLYVEPSMNLVTDERRDIENNRIPARHKITKNMKIDDIFYKGQTKFSRIYISGDAGHGKTALCRMLVLAWCQEHSGLQVNKHIPGDFLTVMKTFELLFYIPLRNIRKDWIISEIIKKQYFDGRDFPNMFKEKCDKTLVILDGLDEWILPEDYETPLHTTHGLPDLRHVYNCSILTTTRPWKLEMLRLKEVEMDREVRLTGINPLVSYRYISDMIDLLNKKKNVKKDHEVFKQQLHQKQLTDLLNIPILLKQLITLWHHDENEIFGNSKVHLYSAMINHILNDAWVKNNKESLPFGTTQDSKLPPCLQEKQHCRFHNSLLLSLAHLAFTSACKGQLIFDHVETELQSLTKDDIKSCLTAGLLCQEIYASLEDDEKKKVSFLHKSFQDFLAATYLVMHPESVEQISESCNTYQKILEMRSLFIFVSGMDSGVMKLLSQLIKDIMVNDEKSMMDMFRLTAIQELMCECVEESKCSGQTVCLYHLENICLGYMWQDCWQCLQHLIRTNITCIKTVYIGDVMEDSLEDFLTCLNLVFECRSVQHLHLLLSKRLPLDIEAILDKALCGNWLLTTMILHGPGCDQLLLKYLCSDRVTTLNSLDVLYMYIQSSEEYESVMKLPGKATQFKRLELGRKLTFRQMYGKEKNALHLDLSKCSQLKELTLQSCCGFEKVSIRTASLTSCEVTGTPVHFVTPQHVWSPLQMLNLSNIKDPHCLVELATNLPQLTQLSHLELRWLRNGFAKKVLSQHMDLSLLSKLQKLTLAQCDVTKVTVNTASLNYCVVAGTSLYFIQHSNVSATPMHFVQQPHVDTTHLTLLSHLEICKLDNGDRNVCLSPEAIHLEKIILKNVIMEKPVLVQFLNSFPAIFYYISLEFEYRRCLGRVLPLDKTVDLLPHLTQLTHLTLKGFDFADREVRLSPEATHLKTVKLENVLMNRNTMVKFLLSIPDTCHEISMEFSRRKIYTDLFTFVDKIVDILPHLTRVSYLKLQELKFRDKNVCLSPKASRLRKVTLDKVTMTDRAMIQFLDSVLTIGHSVFCETKNVSKAVRAYITNNFVVPRFYYSNNLKFYSKPTAS